MPVAPEHLTHLLLIDGPLGGARSAVLNSDPLVEGREFDVSAWDASGRTERYVVSRSFDVRCVDHNIVHRKVIAIHRPRVTV